MIVYVKKHLVIVKESVSNNYLIQQGQIVQLKQK